MAEPILSLSEITEVERAYALGAPTLGRAAAALVARWAEGLRDGETLARLLFLRWYQAAEPTFLTGLEAPLPEADALVAEAGGEGALPAEALFALGLLADLFPECLGDAAAWGARSRDWLRRAAEREPASRLFREWPFLVGEAEHTARPRTYVEREVRARFRGRGAYGDYLEHTLLARLRPEKPRVAAG